MIFKSLSVISLAKNERINYFEFSPVGVNMILGEKHDDTDETNGVGKTALFEAIRYCLGAKIPMSFDRKPSLQKLDILFILKVNVNNSELNFARLINDSSYAYIYSNDNNWDLSAWDMYTNDDYKNYIQHLLMQEFTDDYIINAPTFASLRELLMRDEKVGFTGINIQSRNAMKINQLLLFLSLLPYNYESIVSSKKNDIKEIDTKLKTIKEIGKEIAELKSKYNKTEQEICELKIILNDANVSKKLSYDENQYYELKNELASINVEIRKLQFAKKQLRSNVEDLKRNLEKIEEFIDLKKFYFKTIGYFPEIIEKNYDEMYEFYSFMLENRGSYTQKQINNINKNLDPLISKQRSILEKLKTNTEFAKNSSLVRDLQSISNQITEKYKNIAEYKYKISLYSEKSQLEKEKKQAKEQLESLIVKLKSDYEKHFDNISNIISHFNNLCRVSYDSEGMLSYSFIEDTKAKSPTGRIKISCSIEDENAHGRFYMKINMFDVSLLLNRIDQSQGLTFLFHDGSFSKPAENVKKQFLLEVDQYLRKKGKGQYFITANIEEMDKELIDNLEYSGCIVAKLQRTSDDSNRFMGVKY